MLYNVIQLSLIIALPQGAFDNCSFHDPQKGLAILFSTIIMGHSETRRKAVLRQ